MTTTTTNIRTASIWLTVLFIATIFLNAALLFFVQPLFTRIVLPNIGGASAVWTAAMLFFQTVLIAGYLYAHLSTRYLGIRAQVGLHLGLWALALLFLPLSIRAGWSYDAGSSAALQTLALFATGVGLPFAVLSATGPLLQSWYGRSEGRSAQDPYFLYAASNLGSLLALLAFPLVAEPLFGATDIGLGWAGGFVISGALLLSCGLAAGAGRIGAKSGFSTLNRAQDRMLGTVDFPKPARLLRWAFLAFVPSSMMLGVTSRISSDLGSFPLVWVVPLSLYLLTFTIAFLNRTWLSSANLTMAFRAALVVLVALSTHLLSPHLTVNSALLLLAAFTVTAYIAHRILYEERPHQTHLTVYYVTISVGGALGGVFNSLLGPMLFDTFHELRITVALAALLLLSGGGPLRARDLILGLVVGILVLQPVSLRTLLGLDTMEVEAQFAFLALFLAAMVAFIGRSQAAVAMTVAIVIGGTMISRTNSIYQDRSFFGEHRVVDKDGFRTYVNGTTTHGTQRLGEDGLIPVPLSYYSRTGPMGQILSGPTGDAARSVGVVGLGVGSLACYRRPGQDWHFYEIDSVVDNIARNHDLFTFMSDCAGEAPTHLGDARVVLDRQVEMRFDILVVDAFSSDAVPVHLTTTEAVALYRDRLTPGGIILFHISNRYFAIDLPLGRSAAALGMAARIQRHGLHGDGLEPGASPSVVVALARDEADLAALDPAVWLPLESDGGRLWTDDYSDILSILK